jgi:cell division protein ZapA
MSNEPVSVRILDREYTVGCAPDEREGLQAAARLLDARMREVRGNNRMVAVDRIAVLAALNLAHELQQSRQQGQGDDRRMLDALDAIERRLDGLLATAPR